MEHALEEGPVRRPAQALVDLVHAPGGPGVHRGVDVAEGPLVGRELAVRVHVPLAKEQDELVLGEVRVDEGEGQAVEGEIPGRVPRVFPLVRHRDDVAVVQVRPLAVAAAPALGGRRRLRGVALEPSPDVVVVELLGPEETAERLAHHELAVVGQGVGNDRRVERVGLGQAAGEERIEVAAELIPDRRRIGEPELDDVRLAGAERHPIVERGLGARARGVDASRDPAHDVVVDPILHVGGSVRRTPEALEVRVVVGEEEIGRALGDQPAHAERVVVGLDDGGALPGAQRGTRSAQVPGPRIAEPERRQQIERGGVRTSVGGGDADQDVVHAGLGVLDQDVPVAVLIEHARVEQLVLRRSAGRAAGSPPRDPRTERPPADTCRDTSCRNASAWSRDRSSTP